MIVGIIGARGSGKTITMVKQAIEALEEGRDIYLNFQLNLKNINKKYHKHIHILDNEFFKNYSNFKLYNCALFIDEIYVYIDSRTSGSKRNRIWSYFINQTRKRDVDLYFTTQFFSQVEKRLRANTEYFVFPKFYKLKNNDIVKCQYFKIADFGKAKALAKEIYVANSYYQYYDTDEIVNFDEEK